MPTIEFSKKDFESLVGKKFSPHEFEEAMLFVKGEVDKVEGDKITLDVKETNRPDLWGVEGIAQEVRGRIGKEKGIPKLKTFNSNVKVIVDPNTKNIRPAVAAAIAHNIKITEELLVSLISLQEKVTQTFGRKRLEAAIGVYELEKIVPPIHYKAFSPREIKFVPLDYRVEMDLEEILTEHPKGKEFAFILKNAKKYPVWLDSNKNVLSLSPIINSETTGRVKQSTKSVFIEVSGFNQEIVNTALYVMVQAFAMRKAKIGTVKIEYKNHSIITPQVKTKKISLEPDYLKKISGINFSAKQAVELLKKARYNAKTAGKKIVAEYPDYRKDILHAVDVIEDILISHQYKNVSPKKLEMPVFGSELWQTLFLDKARDACVGIGLQEILTFTLTSKQKQMENTELKNEEFVEIANPVSQNWEIFRKNLFPESLEFLNKNKDKEYPQKIFETGKTIELNSKKETRVEEKDKLCVCISDSKANYSHIKSVLDAVSEFLGLKYSLSELTHPCFEKGKSAQISFGEKKGFMGELNQKTMQNFGLETKTIVLEIEI